MEALARLLTRERLLVELLVFKLVEMRQLLVAGETRFLGWAAEEVERATTSVRAAELDRAVLVTSLGDTRGLDEPTLGDLVADAPEPWRSLLEDDFKALRAGATEVADLLLATRRLADAGARSISESLGTLTDGEPPLSAYGPHVRREATAPAPRVQHVL
ncbi:MAG: hypothetical protein JWM02_2814 [Frankiales bacterium]|nr:hypothetical protein [Frankiales bacterium]